MASSACREEFYLAASLHFNRQGGVRRRIPPSSSVLTTALRAGLAQEILSPEGNHKMASSSCQARREAVLKFSITWNTNSRNYLEAQAVVETVLKHEMPESLLQ
uniref:transducin beta-like protein 3 isoform X1 n=1 Tax=Podarcis muralis TaxID=64176 RepID=UPI00109EE790|nr:transducin beta-like protein 3 isoform X1 [Podarcis muralis]